MMGIPWTGLKFGAQTNCAALCLLLAVKLIFKLPLPLLAVSGIIFFLSSCLYLLLTGEGVKPDKRHFAQLLLIWISVMVIFLGAVYHVDRGGWIWFQLTGYNVTLAEDLTDSINVSPKDFAKRHRFFSIDSRDPSQLMLRKGEYDIDHTIVVPPGALLTIEPGVRLRFRGGRSLISYSPIIARGTKNEPILFTAKSKWLKWGVVAVVKAEKSYFEYVTIEHGRQALVNQINFPGSLSIIDSEVEILNSAFINSFGKDAVYVRQGQVLIRANLFKNAYKDGLDLDGGSGVITQNTFINCDDEGIDLSENDKVEAFGNGIYDSRGGRLAADRNLDQVKSQNRFGFPSEAAISNPNQDL